MVGLSTRTSEWCFHSTSSPPSSLSLFLSLLPVVWRCFSQSVVFLYLMNEKTSLLVIVPAGIAAVIEVRLDFQYYFIIGEYSCSDIIL